MVDVRDKNLPQRVIDVVDTLEEKTGDADCLKLLVCKSAPFVWGMQRAINEKIGSDGTSSTIADDDDDGITISDSDENDINDDSVNNGNDNDDGGNNIKDESMINQFFKFLPDLNEFRKNGELCETKYVNCTIFSK